MIGHFIPSIFHCLGHSNLVDNSKMLD